MKGRERATFTTHCPSCFPAAGSGRMLTELHGPPATENPTLRMPQLVQESLESTSPANSFRGEAQDGKSLGFVVNVSQCKCSASLQRCKEPLERKGVMNATACIPRLLNVSAVKRIWQRGARQPDTELSLVVWENLITQ